MGSLTPIAPASSETAPMPDTNSPGVTKAELAAVKAAMPTPATSAPPSVADSSAKGTDDMVYALANHTHASKARKARMTSAAVALLGLTILSVPSAPGATSVDLLALEP